MSFIYPRRINVARPGAQPSAAVGDQGYAPSDDPTLENTPNSQLGEFQLGASVLGAATPGLKGLPASIQEMSSGGRNPTGLPGDAPLSMWRILIPKKSARRGAIQNRDIVIDEFGTRYQVIAAYWNSLGYSLRAQMLEP